MSCWVRFVIRRRNWGDERTLARRSRNVFGIPGPLRTLYTRGLALRSVASEAVRGEWIVPPNALGGAILYYHGGGYVACSPGTHRSITARLARITCLPVFAPDYRLAPENRFPAAVDDAVNAYRYLIENERISPERTAMAGDSAGGGLVLSALVLIRDQGMPMPAYEKILATGGTSVLMLYEDVSHGWQMLDTLVPEARSALRSAGDFIAQHIQRSQRETRKE